MAKFLILLAAALAAVHGGCVRSAGWSTPTPTPTTTTTLPPPPPPSSPGWSSPPPSTTLPETPGWSSSPPPPPPPPPQGWGSVNASLTGELAGAGSGWAAENHAEHVTVIGGGWNGNPAELDMVSGGDAVVSQDGHLAQGANVDGSGNVSTGNLVSIDSTAAASEGLDIHASGEQIGVSSSGGAVAIGQSASAAAAETNVST